MSYMKQTGMGEARYFKDNHGNVYMRLCDVFGGSIEWYREDNHRMGFKQVRESQHIRLEDLWKNELS